MPQSNRWIKDRKQKFGVPKLSYIDVQLMHNQNVLRFIRPQFAAILNQAQKLQKLLPKSETEWQRDLNYLH